MNSRTLTIALLASCISASMPLSVRAGVPLQALPLETLVAPDAAAEDVFGAAVSILGSTVIVGSAFDDDRGLNSGSAYVFEANAGGPGAWGQARKLIDAEGVVGDEFGHAVAVSGERAIVGARRSDIAGTNRGAAFVFERGQGGAGAWGEVGVLVAGDGAFQDYFGEAVAIYGDIAVVGAREDDDLGSQSGSAYVFARNAGGANAWGQVTKLTAADGQANDQFGAAVAIFGDWIVIGAPYGNGLVANAGAAYVFGRNVGGAGNWGQAAKLTASDGALNDRLGAAVAIEGGRVLVGAHTDDAASVDSGSAYLFEFNPGGGTWSQVRKLEPEDGTLGDQFGISVAISGGRALVGAHFDDPAGQESGSAYVFWRDMGGVGNWGQVARILAADGETDDRFGSAVALSDDLAVIGAHRSDPAGTESGSAYVFELQGVGSNRVFRDGFEDHAGAFVMPL